MMDDPHIQKLVETHKMPILQGLTWLKKYEVRSYMNVLDTLYQVFNSKHHPNMLVLGQVCVLLTGMGLVNLQGLIAFFQALNQYCATVFELLFYETEAGKAPVHIKTLHQPTYGRKMAKPDNHKFLLFRVNCWQD
jgi:hypothetical protein